MKSLTPAKSEARLPQSSMAIIGAILAIGVIRLQDKKSINESATQAGNKNFGFRVKGLQAPEPGLSPRLF